MKFLPVTVHGWGSAVARPIWVLSFMALLTLQGCTTDPAESKSFKTVFDHYRNQENVDAISFPPGLVGIFLSDSDPDQAELKKLMQDLSSFRMLILNIEDGKTAGAGSASMKKVVMDFTNRNKFEDLFRLQGGGQDMFLRIQEKDGMVKEAILMMEAEGRFFVIDLRGNISFELFTGLVEGGYLKDLTSLSNIDF